MTQPAAQPSPYSEHDHSLALTVIDLLAHHDDDGVPLDDLDNEWQLEPDVSVSDVRADLREFTDDLAAVEHSGVGALPAIELGDELVPMSLVLVMGANHRVDDLPYVAERLGLSLMDPETAHRTVLRRAADFLAVRIAAVRDLHEGRTMRWDRSGVAAADSGGPSGRTVPGCNFQVTTNTHGLGVNWSGAYHISPHYFGAPSSPTQGVLPSGRFVFGVDGGGYGQPGRWSTNIVTLPGTPSAHLNF